MDDKQLKELVQKYLKLDKEYKEYRNQFFVLLMDREGKTPKTLTREELSKFQLMHNKVEEVHQEWIKAMRT